MEKKETAKKPAGEKKTAKVADKVAAEKIEVKKTVRKAGRTVKEKADNAAAKVSAAVAEKADKAKLADEMAKGRVKAKRETKKAEVKAKIETKKAAVKKPAMKKAAAKLTIKFQSPMGGEITPEEIAAKVPKDAENVYVRIDENKIYWVTKQETGSVEIWK